MNKPLHRMICLAQVAACSLLIAGCANNRFAKQGLKEIPGRSCQEPEELVDVLSRFTTAVNKGDFTQAVSFLSVEDQKKMIAADGSVPDSIQAKMKALNFQGLSNDPKIDLVKGKLTGIFACLPCLDEGPPAVVSKAPPIPPQVKRDEVEKLRKEIAQDFYREVQKGKWKPASEMVHPQEWAVFLDEKGRLTELSKRRLKAIQECDLDALTLVDGRLTGVVVMLEPPKSELYLKSQIFFDHIAADRMDAAIGMILESEKKFFLGEDGKLRTDRKAQLKAMSREDWQRLYLYHDVLLGVAEVAVGFHNL